jgi:hypothetical protein
MFESAHKQDGCWRLCNRFGHALTIPALDANSAAEVLIGVVGTGRRLALLSKTGKPKDIDDPKTPLMASMLESLGRPLYLIDVRRDGTGKQSSWSPREFATEIPAILGGKTKYAFLHLPCLAPSIELLERDIPWREFRDAYIKELSDQDLAVGEAFVEAATMEGGIAVFLCAEPDQPAFDSLSENAKEENYCHRFTLAKRIARQIKAAHPKAAISIVQLDVVDFYLQKKHGDSYVPRVGAVT